MNKCGRNILTQTVIALRITVRTLLNPETLSILTVKLFPFPCSLARSAIFFLNHKLELFLRLG